MERNKKKQPLPQSIPHNDEAEIYVLGSVIIDNRIMGLLDGKIRPNDFFVELNQQIYEAMISLHKRRQKIEIITIREEFTRLELPSTPELQDYLLEIVDAVPATSNIQIYIDIVEEKSIEDSCTILLSDNRHNILRAPWRIPCWAFGFFTADS